MIGSATVVVVVRLLYVSLSNCGLRCMYCIIVVSTALIIFMLCICFFLLLSFYFKLKLVSIGFCFVCSDYERRACIN